jgi:hypothetical protein
MHVAIWTIDRKPLAVVAVSQQQWREWKKSSGQIKVQNALKYVQNVLKYVQNASKLTFEMPN